MTSRRFISLLVDGRFRYALFSGDAASDELSRIAELAQRQLKR